MSSPFKRFRRNFNNICKVKDKFSQDFIFYPMMNFYKFCQSQEI